MRLLIKYILNIILVLLRRVYFLPNLSLKMKQIIKKGFKNVIFCNLFPPQALLRIMGFCFIAVVYNE